MVSPGVSFYFVYIHSRGKRCSHVRSNCFFITSFRSLIARFFVLLSLSSCCFLFCLSLAPSRFSFLPSYDWLYQSSGVFHLATYKPWDPNICVLYSPYAISPFGRPIEFISTARWLSNVFHAALLNPAYWSYHPGWVFNIFLCHLTSYIHEYFLLYMGFSTWWGLY